MRNEKEVLEQILNFAQKNKMVRAVWLNGSRVNPNVKKDVFCDYDVVFAVTEPEYFVKNQDWISYFGDLIIMQQNEWVADEVTAYIFLMQFIDGVRIDLSFDPVAHIERFLTDSLTVVLLDKDKCLKQLPPPNDSTYITKKPSQKEFDETINEFWWCSPYVAKGIWRNELSYAKYMYESVVRICIIKLLAWHIGLKHNWAVNSGLYGKWFKKFLTKEMYSSFEKTYAGVDYEEMWEALFEAGHLVRKIGVELADALGYEYPIGDDKRVTEYLNKIQLLAKEATTF